MKTDFEKAQAMQDTETALLGISQSLPIGGDIGAVLATPLAKFGDAIRLEIDTPARIRSWIAQVSETEFRVALSALVEECRGWFVPQSDAEQHRDLLSVVLRRRDEFQSIKVALRGIAARRRISLGDWEQYLELDSCLTDVDEKLSKILSRADVGQLLEERSPFGYSWADSFRDLDTSINLLDKSELSKAFSEVVPSDEVVTNYIQSGVLHRYVQSAASSNSEFASNLAESIHAFLQSGEKVGLVARIWFKRFGANAPQAEQEIAPSASGALRFAIVPVQKLAAADHDVEEEIVETELGILAPTDAEATLQTTSKQVILTVYPGEQSIKQVELGDERCSAPDSDGNFRLRVASGIGTMRISLLAEDGTVFSQEIALERYLPT